MLEREPQDARDENFLMGATGKRQGDFFSSFCGHKL
jgi:hypothetical protein